MRETRADTRTAMWQALGLHAVLFAIMFAGLHWSRPPVAEAALGDVIEADLVAATDLSASMQRALRRDPEPPPEPRPEPVPEPVVEPPPSELPAELPPPVPEPAPVEQEKVQRDGLRPDPSPQPREQEEKRKPPPQAELDSKAQTPQERQKQKQLEDVRRELEKAQRARELADQKARQLADARVQPGPVVRPPSGNPVSNAMATASYGVAITTAVERQWLRPDSIRPGQRCQVLIIQVPGGEVVDVQIEPGCPFDDVGRRSLEAAILKASPLPYAGFEDVFQRRLVLWFEPAD